MILSYSKENTELHHFPQKIKAGKKIHTIRADYPNRWKVGMPIHHATGLRTKYYNCFEKGICMGIQRIDFHFANETLFVVTIDGERIDNIHSLAHNDGFESPVDFIDYFWNIAQQSKESHLTMKIIHFTNLRY